MDFIIAAPGPWYMQLVHHAPEVLAALGVGSLSYYLYWIRHKIK